jgi:5'-nucleotidase
MTKMEEPNALLLHAGDLFVGDMFFNQYFGVPEFQILLSLGCDAFAVGNHEFDLMPATLKTALDSSFGGGSFPLLSANTLLDDPGVQDLKQYIKPYTIRQVGTVKVGIFGLTTPATNVLSLPAPAAVDSDFVTIAAAYVDTLVSQNCGLVICLSHLGLMYDQLLASYVPGIHAIVGGHDHYALESPVAVQNPLGDTTWIVQANAFYLNVGKLRLTVQDTIVRLLDYALIPIDDSVPEEPTIAATVDMLIHGIEALYGPAYTQQLTYAAEYFEEVADSLMYVGYRDTPAGNLVTDAFRALTNTDIAMEVGGSTAQPLYQGPITGADVFRMVGYGFNTDNGLGYRIATFTMTGAALMMGLEFGLSEIEQSDEFFVQASGMT